MPDAKQSVADAEAELAKAEADLATAEKADEPVVDTRTDAEIIAAAPPLVLPQGTYLQKQCQHCGLKFDGEVPPNMPCPNCGTPVP